MKDYRSEDLMEGTITPLRGSFNKHPGKLNCKYKDSSTSSSMSISGFMTQLTRVDGNSFYYKAFGTASPEKNISCAMVSTIAAIRPILDFFDIKSTGDDKVTDLMVNVLKRIETILHKLPRKASEDTDFYKKWDQFSNAVELENAMKNETNMSADDRQRDRDKLYTILRIMIQKYHIESDKSAIQYKNHAEFKFPENYSPWLRLWTLFQSFNLQLNTFEESFQSYFDEMCGIASLEFSETDIPSMLAKRISENNGSMDIRVTTYYSIDDVNGLIKKQEKRSLDGNCRVLDGLCR